MIVSVIQIDYVVQLIWRNQQGCVVRAIRSHAAVGVFPGIGEARDVVTDPASSAVASVDPALGMIVLEALENSTKILIGCECVRIVSAGRRRNVITPLIIAPGGDAFIQKVILPVGGCAYGLFEGLLARNQPFRMLLPDFGFWCSKKSRVPKHPAHLVFAEIVIGSLPVGTVPCAPLVVPTGVVPYNIG